MVQLPEQFEPDTSPPDVVCDTPLRSAAAAAYDPRFVPVADLPQQEPDELSLDCPNLYGDGVLGIQRACAGALDSAEESLSGAALEERDGRDLISIEPEIMLETGKRCSRSLSS